MINSSWNEADIICHFVEQNLKPFASAEDVAKWLNANVPQDYQITRATAFNWMSDTHEAGWRYLMAYLICYAEGDPRSEMAKAVMNKRNAPLLLSMAQQGEMDLQELVAKLEVSA